MMRHKNYKDKMNKKGMRLEEKRGLDKKGQATIFVIIAVLLVAAVVIIFFFFPDLTDRVTGQEFSPNSFLKSCVEQDLRDNVALLSRNGGYTNPEGFVVYQGDKIKYLCYTSEYYKTCSVQSPMIKTRFEKELQDLSKSRASECLRLLKTEYEKRGYSVSSGTANAEVDIVPSSIRVKFQTGMTISKEEVRNFEGFEINLDSEIYDLLFTAQSIVDFESTFGDSETSDYLQYYPNLKIEKTKLEDGTTIYKLANVLTKEEFRFASRSLAWPPGYGTE
jgi:hypothetical protein